MGAIGDMQKYLQFKAARAMGDAAQASGGGEGGGGNLAGAGVGLGAGMGVGVGMAGMISQAMAGAMQQPAAPAGAAKAATPDVMTLAEAAAYLKVGEADLLSLISGGEVKAKKIGSEYRISKKALDDFLAA
ncbi:MAG: helix-turn-helix domain-containing protein [Chloroflexi bacterium]|nr:helix-turn-helix domain-containing protein [Chloroflexota bacterium]